MEDIIYSLQNLQLSTKQEDHLTLARVPTTICRAGGPMTTRAPAPMTTKKIANICLQLYHENIALKKEIQRLKLLGNIPDPQIPTWVR